MRIKMNALLKWLVLPGLLFSPVAVWALYKPVRVLAPQWVPGITCVTKDICLEDVTRYKQAERLYNESLAFVEANVAAVEHPPRVIFCSTENCFQSFGFNKSAAQTVGVYGMVISPRGWSQAYLRHEMIHHIQAEHLGVYKQWRSPEWFREGMAYALSDDPRPKLAEPFQRYREKFQLWYQATGKDRLWEEAGKL
jgi:hypothetical protein